MRVRDLPLKAEDGSEEEWHRSVSLELRGTQTLLQAMDDESGIADSSRQGLLIPSHSNLTFTWAIFKHSIGCLLSRQCAMQLATALLSTK